MHKGEMTLDINSENGMKSLGLDEKKRYLQYRSFEADLIDTPIFDERMMDAILEGIVQNICIEMDKRNISMQELSRASGINNSHLCKIFSGTSRIGLNALLKIANVLQVSPGEFFPYDDNNRKSNGQKFDEITKEMDLRSCDFLLSLCVAYVRELRGRKRK